MPNETRDTKYYFNGIRDLSKVGIHALTGEADGLSMRMLFDVTDEGRKIICKSLGLPLDTKFADNWNRGHIDDPHVGSIFLTYDQCWPIMVVACFERANLACVVRIRQQNHDDIVFAVSETDQERDPDFVETLRKHHAEINSLFRVFSLPGRDHNGKKIGGEHQPVRGLSSVHAATGRSM